MGDGTQIKFWKDSWCEDQPLRTRFLELFCLVCASNAMVATHLRVHDATHIWDIEFSRPFQNWELEMEVSFVSSFILFPLVGVLWILFVGILPPKGYLRYDPITLFWFNLPVPIFIGEVCGIQKCHLEWLSSYGLRLWVGSSPLIIYLSKG